MSSWCDLRIDGFSIYGSSSYVDDDMLSVFYERDRRIRPDPDGADDEGADFLYEYATSAQAMRERLDALGFTLARARANYAQGHAEEVQMMDDLDWMSEEERLRCRERTYDYWCAAIGRLVPQGF